MEGETSYNCVIDNLKATELRLGLPGTDDSAERQTRGIKRINESDLEGNEAKARVVGWPPVRSYRKNVKVSMDGAPYLRKIDLKVYKGYKEVREGLEDLFKYFSSGLEGCNDSEYAITYEDKDGDWMLVGDIPWEMFVFSCKRLRIMRRSEARGLGSNQ